MEIFGLDPILGAILITATGVGISVLLGWLKGSASFNIRQAAASVIIAFVISIQLVIAEIQIITVDVNDLTLGAFIFGMIAQVAGIDSLAKSAAKAVAKARAK